MAGPSLTDKQWRFEAIDLRAGMAIALWREQRATAHGLPHEHVPALFFSPPHFQPEPLVNTAVALSACRGRFEPGLYVDGGETEASFATPDEVGEFLRRAYINGATGDGTDGGEPGPVPAPPTGEGGPGEAPQMPESPLVQALTHLVDAFGVDAKNTRPGTSRSFSWGDTSLEHNGRRIGNPPAQANDAMVLVTVALALIDELLRRMPAFADPIAWLAWYDDVRQLSSLLSELGVAEQLFKYPPERELDTILRRSRLFDDKEMSDSRRVRLGQMFLFGPAIPQPDSAEELAYLLDDLAHLFHYPNRAWFFPLPIVLEEPLEILSRLPLPQSLHWMLPKDARTIASLYHFLNLMTSEPQAASTRHAAVPFAVCMALFAATCIVAVRPGQGNSATFQLGRFHRSLERMRRAIEQGHAWLIEHLPRQVFATSYEALLGKSKTLRYSSPPDTMPPAPTTPAPASSPMPGRYIDPNSGLGAGDVYET